MLFLGEHSFATLELEAMETFAADRTRRLTGFIDEIRPEVVEALENYHGASWYSPIVEAASVLWLEQFEREAGEPDSEGALRTFQRELTDSLKKTTEPTDPPSEGQIDRIANWVGVYALNSATHFAQLAGGLGEKRWLTMEDDHVRTTHRAVAGQTLPIRAPFQVGDSALQFPGEPVGDPSVWIECRCWLYRTGGDMTNAITAAADELDEELVDDPDEMTEDPEFDDNDGLVDDITEIPVHGVATVEGSPTGDGRMFAHGALTHRDPPLPIRFEFIGSHGGNDTSMVDHVGRIDEMWLDPATHEYRYRGAIILASDHGPEVVEGIIDGRYRGVSVEVDDVVLDVSEQRENLREQLMEERDRLKEANEASDDADVEQNPILSDEEIEEMVDNWVGDGTTPVTTFTKARVDGFTIVPIGAFAEAYIALGHEFEDELDDEQLEAIAACACGGALLSPLTAAALADGAEVDFAPGTKDGPGWITHPRATARIRRYWVHGKGAAKIRWGQPGDFNRCRRLLAKYVQNPDWLAGLCANMHKEAIGVWPGQETPSGHHAPNVIIASAKIRTDLKAEWFANPNFDKVTPLTVTEDGRIFGHLAEWNSCLLNGSNLCTQPPHSSSSYAHFLTGFVETDEGDVAVGPLSMRVGHAPIPAKPQDVSAHYDRSDAVFADVAIGEDAFGIWYAGVFREHIDEDTRREIKATARMSGDWRPMGGKLDLLGAVLVANPGYSTPRVIVASASGRQTALIGAGIVEPTPITASALLTADHLVGFLEEVTDRVEARVLLREAEPVIAELETELSAREERQLAEARAILEG